MKKFLAKILTLLTLASALGSVDLLAKPERGDQEYLADALSHQDHNQSNSSSGDTDCDTEACAQHQCHLGHCQFSVSSSFDVATPKASSLLALSTLNQMIPFDYLSSLIKPPCA